MSRNKFWTLHLVIQTQYRNHLSMCYSYHLIPPTNYILTLVKPFYFVWYVIPLLKTGALALTHDIFLGVDNEKTRKKTVYACLMASIGCNSCPMAASSGFYQSAGPPPLGDARSMVLAHRRPLKWPAKLIHLFEAILFAVALAAAGAIWSK